MPVITFVLPVTGYVPGRAYDLPEPIATAFVDAGFAVLGERAGPAAVGVDDLIDAGATGRALVKATTKSGALALLNVQDGAEPNPSAAELVTQLDTQLGHPIWRRSFRRIDAQSFGAGLPLSGSRATIGQLIAAGRYADLDAAQAAYGLIGSTALATPALSAAEIFAITQVPLAIDSTQAWAAIQGALDVAGYAVIASGFTRRATVHVPDGEWILDAPLQIPSMVTLRGESERGTILRAIGPAGRPALCSYNAEDALLLCNWYGFLQARARAGATASARDMAAFERLRVLGADKHWPLVQNACAVEHLTVHGGGADGDYRTFLSGTRRFRAECPGVLLLGHNFHLDYLTTRNTRGPGLYLRALILNGGHGGELADVAEPGVTDAAGFPPSFPAAKTALCARNTRLPSAFTGDAALPSETIIGVFNARHASSFGALIQANDGVCGQAQISDISAGGYIPPAPPEIETLKPGYMAEAHRTARTENPKDRSVVEEHRWNSGVGLILGCTGQRWDQIHIFGPVGAAMLWVSPDQQYHINFLEVDDFRAPFTGVHATRNADGTYQDDGADGVPATIAPDSPSRFGVLCDSLQQGRAINQLFVSNYFGLKVNQNRKQFAWHPSKWPSDGDIRLDYAGIIGAVNGGVDIGAVRMIETPGFVLTQAARNVTMTYKGETGVQASVQPASGGYDYDAVIDEIRSRLPAGTPREQAVRRFREDVRSALLYVDLGAGPGSVGRDHDITLSGDSVPEHMIYLVGSGSLAGCGLNLKGEAALSTIYWAEDNGSGSSKFNMCSFTGSIAVSPAQGFLGTAANASNHTRFVENVYGDNDLEGLTFRARDTSQARLSGGASAVAALKASGKVAATALANVEAAINTIAKYPGKRVWDLTNQRLMCATGYAAADAWVDGAGANPIAPTITRHGSP